MIATRQTGRKQFQALDSGSGHGGRWRQAVEIMGVGFWRRTLRQAIQCGHLRLRTSAVTGQWDRSGGGKMAKPYRRSGEHITPVHRIVIRRYGLPGPPWFGRRSALWVTVKRRTFGAVRVLYRTAGRRWVARRPGFSCAVKPAWPLVDPVGPF